jgi:hypothetical protein
MNDCNNQVSFILQPWAWFLIISIILFITFIILIEFNHLNTTQPNQLPEWVIILFILILVFLFLSFIMYFWYNRCALTLVVPVVTQVTTPNIYVDECDMGCDDIKTYACDTNQCLNTLMPLSSLRPY